MQKHKVLAFRLFSQLTPELPKKGFATVSGCAALPSQPVLSPRDWPPKYALKLVPPKSWFWNSPDPQMVPKLVPQGPLWHLPEPPRCHVQVVSPSNLKM